MTLERGTGRPITAAPEPIRAAPPADAATITPYQDGPYIVRGRFTVTDDRGSEIALGRRTVALCRCGRSRIRPLCDGTHRAIGFRAPGCSESYDDEPPATPEDT